MPRVGKLTIVSNISELRSKKQPIPKNIKLHFWVRCISNNGRKLWDTETFTQKPAAWKNIISTSKIFIGTASVKVVDESIKIPQEYLLTTNGNIKKIKTK